ncbi:WD40/YVTN/BNR-like repeat-containing protein [Paenibacillus glufosinatiresistens]|uniref:WD40/YVTN/BNR-like repeat-containing protein n=1 Tax=Paenibacillus glufosinatiresistens TaxID=3070657 RepID=UPI00286EB21C|nr:hypothetical protein [Paenibacillus sp. YX.27]
MKKGCLAAAAVMLLTSCGQGGAAEPRRGEAPATQQAVKIRQAAAPPTSAAPSTSAAPLTSAISPTSAASPAPRFEGGKPDAELAEADGGAGEGALPETGSADPVRSLRWSLPDGTGWRLDSAGHGMFSADNKLYRTKDGGASWRLTADSAEGSLPGGPASGLMFVSPDTGWMTVDTPREGVSGLYGTQDGGIHWEQASLDLPAGTGYTEELPVFFGSTSYGLLRLKNDGTGQEAKLFYLTADGGAHWEAETEREGSLRELHWRVTDQASDSGAPASDAEGQEGQIWTVQIGGQSWSGSGSGWTAAD